MTDTRLPVVAGVDTHADTHWAAIITTTGQPVADRQFPATPDGYSQLVGFITGHGRLVRVGVEGTSSYGAGLTRVLLAAGIDTAEVIRPARTQRRRGKSDPIDAHAAATAALTGHRLPVPKTPDGDIDAIRVLLIARRSAVKARSDAIRQIKSILVTAPNHIRERFRHLAPTALIATLAKLRPGPATDDTAQATLTALRNLARRHAHLTEELSQSDADLDTLTRRANPALRAAFGVGPVTAAQLLVTAGQNPHRITDEAAFAALTGTAPIPASSGKTTRHRLNRGGDRDANCAIHQIVLVRMSKDPATRAYLTKRKTDGKTVRETMRCLKRAVARETHGHLTNPQPIPDTCDLRPLRQTKHATLEQAARHLDHWPTQLSRLERGLKRDDHLAKRYRDWLTNLPDPT
ncbi:MAG: IS110 family transposase [Propionibacteriaceae bacterium]|jgi:transposase|nr:IS110 family transposase [Propionibacteriaceae bacterium]